MKNQLKKYSERILLMAMTLFASVSAIAQDGGLDIDVDLGKPEWYEQPWVWVVGAAVFILILVALLRRKK